MSLLNTKDQETILQFSFKSVSWFFSYIIINILASISSVLLKERRENKPPKSFNVEKTQSHEHFENSIDYIKNLIGSVAKIYYIYH